MGKRKKWNKIPVESNERNADRKVSEMCGNSEKWKLFKRNYWKTGKMFVPAKWKVAVNRSR